ncbi:MAG: cbb3-type cytochrome c oxidase subunit II [Verrucomicrobiota bacterium]
MNRAIVIFLGAFAALTLSWAGLLLGSVRSYGALGAYFDDTESKAYPAQAPGLATRGAQVYADLGCAYCHTQQVRGGEPSADLARKWGGRESYARDYIREERVLLGSVRVGPDLRNFGSRAPAAAELYLHLYSPAAVVPGSTMPAHRFLFETRQITGQPSPLALDRVKVAAPAGSEVVPTSRGEALVGYLLSLRDGYNYPEEEGKNMPPPAPKMEGEKKAETPKTEAPKK